MNEMIKNKIHSINKINQSINIKTLIIMFATILVVVIVLFIVLLFLLLIHIMGGCTRLMFPTPLFDVLSIPDQSGKVVIITGGTTGIGRASAEQLYKSGAKLVIITSRSQASADNAAKEIQMQFGSKDHQSKVIGKALALEDHKSIKEFADWFRSLNEPLHVLMLSAGLVSVVGEETPLGLDKTVGCNWFGHFYLQHLLQDIVEKSAPSRIVIVASNIVVIAPTIDQPLETYVVGSKVKLGNQYAIAKLFNVYHALELHKRLRAKGVNNVYVNVVHPGIVATNLFEISKTKDPFPYNYLNGIKEALAKNLDNAIELIFSSIIIELFGLSPLNGALTQLYAATSPDIEKLDISGEFLHPIARRDDKSWYYLGGLSCLTPQVLNQTIANDVWEYGESLIAKLPSDE